MHSISRRNLLKAAVTAPAVMIPLRLIGGASPAEAAQPAYAQPPAGFLSKDELAFVEAAVARIIPTDELGPGAKDAGVATFIDRQLAGPYGRAETWYMQGPWRSGTEEQGYQIKLTPAGLYRAAIRDVDASVRRTHADRAFAELPAGDQDAVLTALEHGKLELPNAPAKTPKASTSIASLRFLGSKTAKTAALSATAAIFVMVRPGKPHCVATCTTSGFPSAVRPCRPIITRNETQSKKCAANRIRIANETGIGRDCAVALRWCRDCWGWERCVMSTC
jgi:hypothetical protein